MPNRPPAPFTLDAALFLDVDGTLADFENRPQDVRLPRHLPGLLASVARELGGALAVVSGRAISDLDELFHPYRFPAAGIHGIERRDFEGRVHTLGPSPSELEPVAQLLETEAAALPGTIVERKGRSVALHFRQAPEFAVPAWLAATRALRLLPPDVAHIQMGKSVYEIKSTAATKHSAISAFMGEVPFAGRKPVFVGDDVTDEDGFRFVEQHGGLAVMVGREPIAGRAALESPAAVADWLSSLLVTSGSAHA